MTEWESALERWRDAELIDAAADARVRAFESSRVPEVPPASTGLRRPAIVALAFGGLMLGAGVHLFAVAQWNNFSPFGRLAIAVATVAAFHCAGAIASARGHEAPPSSCMESAQFLLGAAAFLTTSVRDFDLHWPAASLLLLWAAGAWAAWALRRDWVRFALAAIFTPYWLCAVWADAAPGSAGDRYFLPHGRRAAAAVTLLSSGAVERSGRPAKTSPGVDRGCVCLAAFALGRWRQRKNGPERIARKVSWRIRSRLSCLSQFCRGCEAGTRG